MKWRSVLLAALFILAATFQPPRLVAQAVDDATVDEVTVEDATVEGFDSEKFWTYAGCAASIAIGVGTGGWVLAFLTCGKAATAYWTK